MQIVRIMSTKLRLLYLARQLRCLGYNPTLEF